MGWRSSDQSGIGREDCAQRAASLPQNWRGTEQTFFSAVAS
jgi:hypothetical protein